mmetsp:Transcript_6069/g.26786  ORF Transcript_6069/g.26786 Transcript_6069/m.26786 type:complete len:236 (-) Transcript_6069:182-889(-)
MRQDDGAAARHRGWARAAPAAAGRRRRRPRSSLWIGDSFSSRFVLLGSRFVLVLRSVRARRRARPRGWTLRARAPQLVAVRRQRLGQGRGVARRGRRDGVDPAPQGRAHHRPRRREHPIPAAADQGAHTDPERARHVPRPARADGVPAWRARVLRRSGAHDPGSSSPRVIATRERPPFASSRRLFFSKSFPPFRTFRISSTECFASGPPRSFPRSPPSRPTATTPATPPATSAPR